jgi:malate/lactate dehydrogenase
MSADPGSFSGAESARREGIRSSARALERRRRVGIIGGAGTLGSTMAFQLAAESLLEEVVLVDVRRNVLQAHAMDIEQAIAPLSRTEIVLGEPEDLERCGVVILAASVHEADASDRAQFMAANLPIVASLAQHLRNYCGDAVVVNATNPVDIFNFLLWTMTGLRRTQFLGFSMNDSVRFCWAIAKVLGVSASRVDGIVIGEHGPDQILLFSTVTVDGTRVELAASEKAEVLELVRSWFQKYTGLRSGRTSGWTSAVSALALVRAIVVGSDALFGLSVIPDGEYGLTDVSLALPVNVCASGVDSIAVLDLSEEETVALGCAAAKIRLLIDRCAGSLA